MCKEKYRDVIEEHLLTQGKTANLNVFKKYRPNYVEQTGVLTQFACDNCTEFDSAKIGLDSASKYIHDCRTKQCRNYVEYMGDKCTCNKCKECLIINYGNMDAYSLLKELCCSSEATEPKLFCAEGKCLVRSCCPAKYERLLLFGRGCHTYKGRNIVRDVEFKRVEKVDIDDKKYKFVVYDTLPWKESKVT